MPTVTKNWAIQNTNDPSIPALDTTVDLALLLSEHYGKNIRQGANFRVKAMQATLIPAHNSALAFLDTGISAVVHTLHTPTTKHSRRAWNEVFRQWKRQKQLAGTVGSAIANDDMEFAWEHGSATSRTSTIMAQGIGDNASEQLCLTGDSSLNTDFVLKDYYNSTHKPTPASLDHFSNSVIKENKFGDTMYPENLQVNMSCYNSTDSFIDWDVELGATIIDMEALTAAAAEGPIYEFPSPLDVLCGVFRLRAYVMPDDTVVQVEEDFTLSVTFYIESWKPLIYRRKSKRANRGRTWFGRKSRRTSRRG